VRQAKRAKREKDEHIREAIAARRAVILAQLNALTESEPPPEATKENAHGHKKDLTTPSTPSPLNRHFNTNVAYRSA
jgi:hypothetical protein